MARLEQLKEALSPPWSGKKERMILQLILLLRALVGLVQKREHAQLLLLPASANILVDLFRAATVILRLASCALRHAARPCGFVPSRVSVGFVWCVCVCARASVAGAGHLSARQLSQHRTEHASSETMSLPCSADDRGNGKQDVDRETRELYFSLRCAYLCMHVVAVMVLSLSLSPRALPVLLRLLSLSSHTAFRVLSAALRVRGVGLTQTERVWCAQAYHACSSPPHISAGMRSAMEASGITTTMMARAERTTINVCRDRYHLIKVAMDIWLVKLLVDKYLSEGPGAQLPPTYGLGRRKSRSIAAGLGTNLLGSGSDKKAGVDAEAGAGAGALGHKRHDEDGGEAGTRGRNRGFERRGSVVEEEEQMRGHKWSCSLLVQGSLREGGCQHYQHAMHLLSRKMVPAYVSFFFAQIDKVPDVMTTAAVLALTAMMTMTSMNDVDYDRDDSNESDVGCRRLGLAARRR